MNFRFSRLLVIGILTPLSCHGPSASPPHTPGAATAATTDAPAATGAAPAPDDPWGKPYPKPYTPASPVQPLSWIRVEGNHFVDETGNTRRFMGLNIADPDKLERDGHWQRGLFEVIHEWGASVVRLPVHPAAWRARGQAEYFELLDQAVAWATELDLYLIIDWHSIGNLRTGLFQHPMYDTDQQETFEFWRQVAFRYQGVPTVAFYELFNEPTLQSGKLGTSSWEQWKTLNEELISMIYAYDKRAIPLVGGFDWAYDLRPVKEHPIERSGIAYVSHPYPQKTGAPFETHWDEAFGFAAGKYPLFTTEIGYMPPDAPGAHEPVRDDGSYGPRITRYLEQKGASWTAWCFDPEWAPPLISDWSYTPTESGKHFREVMLARRAATGKP
jgi:endoglucanase